MHNLGVVCIVHNKLERKNIHLGECPIKHVGYGSCTLSDCLSLGHGYFILLDEPVYQMLASLNEILSSKTWFSQLFLMKRGGQEIYVGPLGRHSCHLIKYFEVRCVGQPKTKSNSLLFEL